MLTLQFFRVYPLLALLSSSHALVPCARFGQVQSRSSLGAPKCLMNDHPFQHPEPILPRPGSRDFFSRTLIKETCEDDMLLDKVIPGSGFDGVKS